MVCMLVFKIKETFSLTKKMPAGDRNVPAIGWKSYKKFETLARGWEMSVGDGKCIQKAGKCM